MNIDYILSLNWEYSIKFKIWVTWNLYLENESGLGEGAILCFQIKISLTKRGVIS